MVPPDDPTPTNLPRRAAALAMAETMGEVDVLVVGAGINGAGLFRDLALQGVRALIVDRLDFGAGASMASSRMAHGGLRYLENGEFRLTAEATRERNRLLRNAPHMVRPLPMVIPFFSLGAGLWTSFLRVLGRKRVLRERGFAMAEAGLLIYDWFGRIDRGMPLHRPMPRSAMRKLFPSLHPAVRAASLYYDAVIDAPERIAVELVSDGLAASPESVALNRCAVEGVAEDGRAVALRDVPSGRHFTVRPRLVLNAAGAWIDAVNGGLRTERPLMGGTRGSHLVLRHPELFAALAGHGMIFDDGAGRVCILYPIALPGGSGGQVLLGSTDIPVAHPDEARCTAEEQDYLLKALRVVFPGVDAGPAHVVFRFSGVRPLPRSDAATPGAVSRNHSLPAFEPDGERHFPVLSLVGGKWTTFRAFAAQACDAALLRLGRGRVADTSALAIGGGRGLVERGGPEGFASGLAHSHGLAPAHAAALVNRYGAAAEAVGAFLNEGADRPLPGAPLFTEREIRRLARFEMAAGVDDIVLRRTTLAMEGLLSDPLLVTVAAILAEESGQSDADRDAALARFTAELRDVHAVPNLSAPPRSTNPTLASVA